MKRATRKIEICHLHEITRARADTQLSYTNCCCEQAESRERFQRLIADEPVFSSIKLAARDIAAVAIKYPVMGKYTILVVALAMGWSWMTQQHPVGSATPREGAASMPERDRPSHPSPSEIDDDTQDQLRDIGGKLWEQLLRPALVATAAYALNGLSWLLRRAAEELPNEHATQDSGRGSLTPARSQADR